MEIENNDESNMTFEQFLARKEATSEAVADTISVEPSTRLLIDMSKDMIGIKNSKIILGFIRSDLSRYVYEAESGVLHLHFKDNNYLRLDNIEESIANSLSKFMFNIGVN